MEWWRIEGLNNMSNQNISLFHSWGRIEIEGSAVANRVIDSNDLDFLAFFWSICVSPERAGFPRNGLFV